MKIFRSAILLAALTAAPASWAQAGAPPPTTQPVPPPAVPAPPAPPAPPVLGIDLNIRAMRTALVPFVALPLDTAQKSDPIWFEGERPAGRIIARLSLKPAESVAVEQDMGQGPGKPLVLHRAVTGEPGRFETADDIGSGPQRIYCADRAPLRAPFILCLEDRDSDGVFDNRIHGLAESGDKAEQLSILTGPTPLASPLRYRPATAAEVPEIKAMIINCGRDHDRPLYSFDVAGESGGRNLSSLLEMLSAPAPQGGSEAEQRQRLNELNHAVARMGGTCETAERVREGEPLHPGTVAKGGAVARLGELVVAIGPKAEGAPVRLLGLREPARLYRLVHGGVRFASAGLTTKQKALVIEQRFDRPVLVATGSAEVAEGKAGVNDVVLTAGFRHGYMGVLTQDTVIRTLFSKRSLPAGTVVYGVPMSMRRVMSIGGRPIDLPFSPGVPDPDQVGLVWCVPVQDGEEWTATCLPHQGAANRYTLLKGQRPAFEVSSMRFAAGMSTNEGEVPVEEKQGDFGKPLSYRFRIRSIGPAEIGLTQETMFGDAVVGSKELRIPRVAGAQSGLAFGGGLVTFSPVPGEAHAVMVKQERPVKADAPAWSQVGAIAIPASAPIQPAPPGVQPKPSE